jgi:hypothetical protein
MSLTVTATDNESGETHTVQVADGDYVLIPTSPCYLAATSVHANGTHVLTVKGRVQR